MCTPSGTNKTQDILTLSCAIEVLSKSSKTHYIRWIQALDVNDNNWIINNETYNITERRMSNQIQSSVSTIESILTLNISNARHSGFYYWCIVFNNKDKLYPVSQQVFITKQINSFSCIDKSDYKTKCLSYPPLSSSATRSVSSDDMSVDTIVAIVIPVILFVILVCLIIIFAILIVRKLKQTSRHDIKGEKEREREREREREGGREGERWTDGQTDGRTENSEFKRQTMTNVTMFTLMVLKSLNLFVVMLTVLGIIFSNL